MRASLYEDYEKHYKTLGIVEDDVSEKATALADRKTKDIMASLTPYLEQQGFDELGCKDKQVVIEVG